MNAAPALRRPFEAIEGGGPPPAPVGSGAPAFSFQRVTKAFGSNLVLDGIDLEVGQGEFVAVIGKSGCGKSTLLRLLAGLDQPSSGSIRLAESQAGKTGTRVMFQEARLLPWARVAANVAVGLIGIAKGGEREERTRAMLREVGLEARAGDWPAVLSGGQKSRVALARALVGNPQILALDEPMGALDALTRIEMQALLERIWLAQRFTAVLVTHDVAEAVALADRAIVIEAGHIVLDLVVPLPRPRRHGSAEVARLEGAILDKLFGRN